MRSHKVIVVLMVMMILSACATSAKAPISSFTRVEQNVEGFTKHFEESAFAIGTSRLFSVELLLMDGTISVGRNDLDIIIHDARDSDVAGAKLTIIARHRDTGIETSPEKITEDARIHGLYTAMNLEIPEPGHWRMTMEVRMEGRVDTVTFDFPEVGQAGGGARR